MLTPFSVVTTLDCLYKYTAMKNNREALYEELDAANNTGYSTEALVNIIEAHRADQWEDLTDEAWEAMKKRILENHRKEVASNQLSAKLLL